MTDRDRTNRHREPLYELHVEPDLESPALLLALDGWIDAGFGAAQAVNTLLSELDTYPIATFDADVLLDHRARRPVMNLIEGVNTGLTWPSIELRGASDLAGNDMLLLVGAEPDHLWRAFCTDVIDLITGLGTRMIVGLGAYPAAVPHTRPTQLSCTANSEELAARWQFLRGSLDVPAGVHAAIELMAGERGLDAIGVWAQVPHYTAGMPYPAASQSLLVAASEVSQLMLPTGTLEQDAADARARLDEIIAGNDEHARMVSALESESDSTTVTGPLPSGDELAAELERFLRDQAGPE